MKDEDIVQDNDMNDEGLLLELLADDELSTSRRKALLADMASRPDGWQRVAEALLDAQSLTRTLRSAQVSVSRRPELTRGRSNRWVQATVVAATVLIAFIIGFTWPREMMVANRLPEAAEVALSITRLPESPQEFVVASSPLPEVPMDAELLMSLASLGEDDHTLRVEFRKSQTGGVVRYATHQELPPFMLQALADAGHQVDRVQYDVSIAELLANDHEELQGESISVYETQITPGFLRHL